MNRNEIIADTLHKAGVAGSMQLADLIAEAIGQNENILAGYLEQAFVAGERAEFDRLDKKARQNPPWPLRNKHTERESTDWQPPFAQEADSL